jgi:hypothetical protein
MRFVCCRIAHGKSTTTSVTRFPDIRSEFPGSAEAIGRLEALLSKERSSGSEYSLEHLYERIHPDSVAILAALLSWLTEHRYVDRIFRVVSPSGAGLRDYASLRDVPSRIRDDVDTGEEMEVTDKNIEVVYRLR